MMCLVRKIALLLYQIFFKISLQKSAESGLLKVYERLSITFSQLYMYMDPGPPETPGSLVS